MGQQLAKQMSSAFLTQDNSHREQLVKELTKILEESLGDQVECVQKKTVEVIQAFKIQLGANSDNSKPKEEPTPFQIFHPSPTKAPTPQLTQSPLGIFESQISSLTQTDHQICSTIVEIMSTRKLYHIRQSFRRLSLQVLNLENAEFYVFHDSGKVEYHDFNENYITQLLENDQKRKVIQYVLANAAEMVENVEMGEWLGKKELKKQQIQSKIPSEKRVSFCQQSQLFMKLFNPPTDSNLRSYGQINKQNQKYSILSIFTFNKENSHSFLQINPKIVHNLIKISMIQIEEETEYDIIKFYCKELLDVLGLIIGYSETKVKKLLKAEREKLVENKMEQLDGKSSSNGKLVIDEKLPLIDTIKRSFPPQHTLLQSLLPSALKYQQFRYQLLQRQRMYSKYLCEDNVIFMDFNEQGELHFLSNNRKNSEYETVLNELIMTDELCIEKIFQENVPLQEHIRKSLDDEVKNKKLYDLENGLKARVIRNQANEIQRIMVLVEDPPIILNQGVLSQSTLQGASSSKKDQKKKKHGSSGSDNVSLGKISRGSANLIRTLEKQNPGQTENGWLTLFIKDHELKRNNSTVMSKKKGTLFAKGEQGPKSLKVISPSLNFQEVEFLQQQDINSPDTNLLTFKIEYLEPFVKKVFKSMSFFNSLEYNKEHFDNFLFHLHDGYQLHENSFHNFTHGVNVMHSCFLICGIEGNAEILNPLKVFSTVFSGLCHDVGHTGRTNAFEIASRSKKAITYNDLSPLENFHVSYACEILRRPENNFLQSLSLEEYNEIRKDMISNILYTDIKEHFPLIKKFKAVEYKPKEKPLSVEDLRILTGMIVHTSDFGGSAKEFEVCAEWSRRVNLEFIAQYKQEQELGIAQTPFFKDLQVESIMAKNEMGFLKVIVFPLYEVLDDFYKDQGVLHKLRIYAEKNIKEWQKVHISSSAIKNEEKIVPKEEQKKQN